MYGFLFQCSPFLPWWISKTSLVKVRIPCPVDPHPTGMELVSPPVNVNPKEDPQKEAVQQGNFRTLIVFIEYLVSFFFLTFQFWCMLCLHLERYQFNYYQPERHLHSKSRISKQLWRNQYVVLHDQQVLWRHLLVTTGLRDVQYGGPRRYYRRNKWTSSLCL